MPSTWRQSRRGSLTRFVVRAVSLLLRTLIDLAALLGHVSNYVHCARCRSSTSAGAGATSANARLPATPVTCYNGDTSAPDEGNPMAAEAALRKCGADATNRVSPLSPQPKSSEPGKYRSIRCNFIATTPPGLAVPPCARHRSRSCRGRRGAPRS